MSLVYCERARVADARRMAYSFFADVLSAEVTKEFVAGMASFEADSGTQMAKFVESLKGSDLDEVTQDVRSEFCALFLNMSAHPVFTSESVYLSDNHVIMQEPRDQIVDIYRSYKLAVDKEFDWPEDHVSMEMLFMAHLCRMESELCESASEASDESIDERIESLGKAQKAFFSEHLGRWVPMLADELATHAKTLFYKGVAEYLHEFLEDEREYLGVEA